MGSQIASIGSVVVVVTRGAMEADGRWPMGDGRWKTRDGGEAS